VAVDVFRGFYLAVAHLVGDLHILVEYRRELAVAVTDEEFEPGGVFAEVHEQVAGLLGGPCPGGAGGDAQDVHAAGLDLHHEEHSVECSCVAVHRMLVT
jgi:hypothetical protein